jgi:hypothetical protein
LDGLFLWANSPSGAISDGSVRICYRGIGVALTNFALDWMKEMGMSIAMVETGADPGHSPARHTYAQAGFELMPIARYFKKL